MVHLRRIVNLPAAFLAALLLVGAQGAALAHDLSHDTGSLPGQSCATCVTAAQLGHGCIDTPVADDGERCGSTPICAREHDYTSVDVPIARQRGPPLSL